MARVLVVDDDRSIRRTLEKFLGGEGYEVTTASDGREAIEKITSGAFDVVLLDLGLPEVDGMDVLAHARKLLDPPAVLVVTAREDMRSTVQAMKLGAHDYLVKPIDVDRLKGAVAAAAGSRAAAAPDGERAEAAAGTIIGRSAAIREIWKTIGGVSTSRATVLITGESGTGKELIARAIHQESDGRDAPFVAVNCTAFARDLLESELFGHVRGAFTGAVADKIGRFELAGTGTLLLDEVGEIPLELQAKLLRVLQERCFERVGDVRTIPFKARVIAATHRDLNAMVREGAFREDLLYRLRVVEIRVPPLRERREDIPLLVDALLAKINREVHKKVRRVPDDARALLESYAWPGNVRELENALTRAVVLGKGDVLEASLLPIDAGVASPARRSSEELEVFALRDVEKSHILRVLRHTDWNKRRAAALLEISRPTLDRKIEEYALAKEGD